MKITQHTTHVKPRKRWRLIPYAVAVLLFIPVLYVAYGYVHPSEDRFIGPSPSTPLNSNTQSSSYAPQTNPTESNNPQNLQSKQNSTSNAQSSSSELDNLNRCISVRRAKYSTYSYELDAAKSIWNQDIAIAQSAYKLGQISLAELTQRNQEAKQTYNTRITNAWNEYTYGPDWTGCEIPTQSMPLM